MTCPKKNMKKSLGTIRKRLLSVIDDMQYVIDSLQEEGEEYFTKKDVSELIGMECSKLCDYFEKQLDAVARSNGRDKQQEHVE